jgi:hypothetical protein
LVIRRKKGVEEKPSTPCLTYTNLAKIKMHNYILPKPLYFLAWMLQGSSAVVLLQAILNPLSVGFVTTFAATSVMSYGFYKKIPMPYSLYAICLMVTYVWGVSK